MAKIRTVTYEQAREVIGSLFAESGNVLEIAQKVEKMSKLSDVILTKLEEDLKCKLETDDTLEGNNALEIYSEILDLIQGISIVQSMMGNKAEQLIAVSRNIDEIASQIDDYFNLSETDKYTLPS